MKRAIILSLVIVLAAASVSTAAEVSRRLPKPVPASVNVRIPGLGQLALAGPFVHKNLAVFVFHDTGAPLVEPDYITLEEGVKAGLVTISEQGDARVQGLVVSNRSTRPLFIQVGEIVKGGKQDRTMQASLVIPAKSNNVPIPSFCVERGRWSGGQGFSAQGVIVPDLAMKQAVHARKQGSVWRGVQSYKRRAGSSASSYGGRPVRLSRSSSVVEELGDKDFGKLTGEYVSSLEGLLARFKKPRGLATVIDGRLSTVDVYHASTLMKKLYPKLLRSAAAEAGAGKFKRVPNPFTIKQLADFLARAWDGRKHREVLGVDNVFVRITSRRALVSQLLYKDSLIHVQVLRTGPTPIPLPRPMPTTMPRLQVRPLLRRAVPRTRPSTPRYRY